MRMRIMSFAETGHSTGKASVGALLKGEELPASVGDAEFTDVVNRLVSGGFPGWHDLAAADAQMLSRDWLDQIIQRDLPQILGLRRNPQLVEEYLRALAQMVRSPRSSLPSADVCRKSVLVRYPKPLCQRFTSCWNELSWLTIFPRGRLNYALPRSLRPHRFDTWRILVWWPRL